MYFALKEAHEGKVALQKSEKSKTVAVIVAMCLNLGINPPDQVKPENSAKLLTWQLPKNSDTIIRNVQMQYQLWHPRAKYKLLPDPSLEDLKKVCVALRKAAKSDRILIHYNGYGVPKPTSNGEIWVFNKQYTQYLPVSLHDLQHWTQSPSIFVWDCNNAGNLLKAYKKFAAQKDKDLKDLDLPLFTDNIQFAACQPDESVPLHPDVPADFFTSCLTTPIIIALRCWVLENRDRFPDIDIDKLIDFPGKLNDRKTPLGELNWIFTAVVDTIAWGLFPRDDFKKLFRNDLLVAALYRNFLLAQRLMRQYGCTPICDPPVSIYAYRHHLWSQWDVVLEKAIKQIPQIMKEETDDKRDFDNYEHSSFFSDQLTAFEIWLEQRSGHVYKSPEQLPILLQVLLSQAHRSRALILLAKFLDLGAWAINEALSVGIFPYCLKLLQSPAPELRPVLCFIWARLLSIESDFQNDIVKDNGFLYFFQGMGTQSYDYDEKTFYSLYLVNCAFVLSKFVKNHNIGKDLCMKNGLVQLICRQFQELNTDDLSDEIVLSKEWLLYALASICEDFKQAITIASNENALTLILPYLQHKIPRVRAAVIHCLNSLFSIELFDKDILLNAVSKALYFISDISVLVRLELLSFVTKILSQFSEDLSHIILLHLQEIKHNATFELKKKHNVSPSMDSPVEKDKFLDSVWKALLIFSVDPHDEIRREAQACLDAHIITFFGSWQEQDKRITDEFSATDSVIQVIKLSQKPFLRKTKSFADSLRHFTQNISTSSPFTAPSQQGLSAPHILNHKIHEMLRHIIVKPHSFNYASKLMISTLDSQYSMPFNKEQTNTCHFLMDHNVQVCKKYSQISKFESLKYSIPIDYKCDDFVFHPAVPLSLTVSRMHDQSHIYAADSGNLLSTIHDRFAENLVISNSIFVNTSSTVNVLNTFCI
eukprot:NODE_271_length_11194_cov_0.541595.p1 type:complete len:932 gc:universal NODE_271_length_11194_cov_0.541595:7846-10641(+)